MDVPVETFLAIGSYLNSIDLSNLRLVNRQYANLSKSLIPQHGLSVMNTTRDMEELHRLLLCGSIARNVKSLRIFHVEWPICSRKEWETHRLLFRGNLTIGKSQSQYNKAFAAYEEFAVEQHTRRYSEEVDKLAEVLRCVPNLKYLTISSMHNCFWNPTNARYKRLQKRIWISPYHSTEVSSTLESFLLASKATNLQSLKINGTFDPGMLSTRTNIQQLSMITSLQVHRIRVCNNDKSTTEFLRLFSGLTDLSLSFQGWGPAVSSLNSTHWESLKTICLHGMWMSEDDYFGIFDSHASTLKTFELQSSALTLGSWKKLFTRIRAHESQAHVLVGGELYGRSSKETLNMNPQAAQKLTTFLDDVESQWPF